MNVPTYEEFQSLQQTVDRLQQQIAYLMGSTAHTEWLSPAQVKQVLNCSQSTLDRLRQRNLIAYRYQGRKPLFEAQSVRQYILTHRIDAAEADRRILVALNR